MIILRRTAYYMRALGRESVTPPQNAAWLAANAYELNSIFVDIERAARNNQPNISTHHHSAIHRHDIRRYLESHGYRVDHHTITWDHAITPPPLY